MNKMSILIKGKANEVKRKIIRKLGGYTQEDFVHALTTEDRLQYRPKTYSVEELYAAVRISNVELKRVPQEVFKRDICRQISEYLMKYAEFSLSGPVFCDLPYYDMIGTIKVLQTEMGGVVNLENYHGPALRKEDDAAEVDRRGGLQ